MPRFLLQDNEQSGYRVRFAAQSHQFPGDLVAQGHVPRLPVGLQGQSFHTEDAGFSRAQLNAAAAGILGLVGFLQQSTQEALGLAIVASRSSTFI